MTLYLNLRRALVGGFVLSEPYMLAGNGETGALAGLPWGEIPRSLGGRNLLFIVHGFNVDFAAGARMFERLQPLLDLAAGDVAIGVLWPGDSWIPVIDYPFEGDVAITSGNALAKFCRDHLAEARSLSFASHSLGARVVLQALLGLPRPARSVTLMAGAINQNCLIGEYADAARNPTDLSLLASRADMVLKLAFPVGDLFADMLHDDHPPFQPALGYAGPSRREAALVEGPWRIPPDDNYDHGDYLPPSAALPPPPRLPPPYRATARYVRNAFYGQPQPWPPP